MRRKHRKKAKPDVVQAYRDKHDRCAVCGLEYHKWQYQPAELAVMAGVAHIVGGTGREDDERNLIMLCGLCHTRFDRLSTLTTLIFDGVQYEQLTVENILSAKKRVDGSIDVEYLRNLLPSKGVKHVRGLAVDIFENL